MRRFSYRVTSKNGSIAVTCLVILIILSIASVSAARIVIAQMGVTARYVRWSVCPYLAISAFRDSVGGRDATPLYDSQAELAQERRVEFGDGSGYAYTYDDEGSKININTAQKSVLEKLPGMTDDAAEGITMCNRRPFSQKEEVLLAEGMTRALFESIKDYITVFGDSKININTVRPEVLAALGFDQELIDVLARYRKESAGPDGKQGTDDDGAFASVNGIAAELSKFEFLTANEEMQIVAVANMLTVKSTMRSLKVVTLLNGKPALTYSLIIAGVPKRIIRWLE
jgi:hypothetical protein